MSWEAWGSGDDPIDIDAMYQHGWESDADCEKWWKKGEPAETFTFEEASRAYLEWLWSDDYGVY